MALGKNKMNKKEIIKSKFNFDSKLNFLIVFCFAIPMSLAFLIKVIMKDELNLLGIFFVSTLFFISIFVLKTFKFICINTIKNEIKYYSIIQPFGKSIKFNEFIGFILSEEITAYGNKEIIYLVDKKGFTDFKIYLSYYKNKEDIKNTIPLKEIKKYNRSFFIYLKLIFTGKIKVINK